MNRHRRYFELVQQRPELFHNENVALRTIVEPDDFARIERVIKRVYRANGDPAEWGNLGVLAEDPWFIVLRDAVFADGNPLPYTRILSRTYVRGCPGVVVLPSSANDILLVKHFRHSDRSWRWEVPRGFGDDGATSEENAKRELLEETGIVAETLLHLGSCLPDSGAMASRVDVFFAEVKERPIVEIADSCNEGISETRWFSFADFEGMIRDGRIVDGFTISAYGLALAHRLFA